MSTAPYGLPGPPAGHPAPPLDRPELPAGVEPTPIGPQWKAWTAWVALVGGFAAAIAGALIIGIVAAGFGASLESPPPSVNILATVVQDLSLVGAAILMARTAATPHPWDFALRPTRLWPAVGWIAVLLVSFFLATALWVALLGIKEPSETLPKELGADDSTLALVSVTILVCIIAPLCEEFFFRGYFFTALRSWRGMWPAALITGLVFGAIHAGSADPAFLVPLGLLGMGLCLLYVRTGSLYPCVAAHALNNSIAFGVARHWGAGGTLALIAGALLTITLVFALVRIDQWSRAEPARRRAWMNQTSARAAFRRRIPGMNRMAAALIAVTMLVVPAAASAQSTTPAPAPAPTTTSGAPAPAPAAAPAKGRLKLSLQRVGSGGVLAGSRWVVRGTLTPYVSGQRASVRFYRHNRKIAVNEVAIKPAGGKVGRFTLGFRAKTPGTITVRATHRETSELATIVAPRVSVSVLPLRATPGARGLAVRVLQQRLSRLGYVVGRRGLYDDRTARAVTAFRKVTGMERTTIATSEVFRRLSKGQGRFHVRYPSHGRHVEGDIGHQVLALINGSKVERIYPMSSGKPSTPTVIGNFRVYMRDFGTNGHGMVDSSYFIRGYAIHGYAEVPVYNASHGCLRIPVPDAASVYRWVRLGTRVDTYR